MFRKIPAADKKKPKEKRNWDGPGDDPNKKIDYCEAPPTDAGKQNGNAPDEQEFVIKQVNFLLRR